MRAGFLLLLVAAVELRAQCPDGSPPPCTASRKVVPPIAQRARSFMFLPFRNVTRRPEHDWLVAGAPTMLGQSVGQFTDLNVVGEDRMSAARRRLRIAADSLPDAMQRRALANETGGWTAVSGTVIASGSRLRITYEATDVPTGRAIARGEREVNADADIRTAFDAIAIALLEPAGVPAGGNALAVLTTRSVDAYRAYLRGVAHQNRSEFRHALDAYTAAVRLDSTFALAWANVALITPSVRGMQEMMLPTSMIYRAIGEAARHASQLPPTHAGLIRALQAFSRARFRDARRITDSIVSSDPTSVPALELLATMYSMSVFLSQSPSGPEIAADVNRSLELVRRALALDPNRGGIYALPAMIYGMTGGLFWAHTWSDAREFTSLPFMLMTVSSAPQRKFVPLFRDSVYYVAFDEFRGLSAEEQRRLRRPGAERGMQWVQEWLTVAPVDADAHLWRSRLAELLGDHATALRAFATADSLGIQSGLEDPAGRGLSLLVLNRRHDAAAAIADSLLATGRMTRWPFLASVDRRWTYGIAALLLARRWDRAGELASVINSRRRLPIACEAVWHEMALSDAPVSEAIRREIMDSVSAHARTVGDHPVLGPCVRMLSTNLVPARRSDGGTPEQP